MSIYLPIGRKYLLIHAFFFCLSGISQHSYAQQVPIEISDQEPHLNLNPYLYVLEDAEGKLKIDDIIRMDDSFHPYDTLSRLNKNSFYWGRISVINKMPYPGKWMLSPDHGKFLKRNCFVEAYFLPGGEVRKTGRLLPYSEKDPISSRPPDNQIYMDLDGGEQTSIYLKIWQIDKKRPVFNVHLMEYAYWRGDQGLGWSIMQAFFQGIVWIMFFYALTTYWSLKDKTYLYYALFLFSTSFYFLYLSGILSENILKEYPISGFYVWIFATNLLAVGYFQFARNFLHTKKLIPFWDRMGRGFIAGLLVLMVLELIFISLTLNQAFINNFNNLVILFEVSFLLIVSLRYFTSVYGLSRIFIWGTMCLVIAGFLGVYFEIQGILREFLPVIEFFFVLEIVTFSRGLSYRHYINKKQRYIKKSEAENLKKLDQMKSRFFANISHEFRTPLTLLMGTVDNLKKNWSVLKKEAIDKQLNVIYRNSSSLLKLVNQILDLTKLESRSMEVNWQHGDIVEFIRYLIEPFATYAKSRSLSFRAHFEEDKLLMDFEPGSIQNILSNLVSNAFKFTPEGGEIYLEVKSGVFDRGKCLEIVVEDTGYGIPEDDLPFVFERYYQSDSNKIQSSVGSGIGLALVKEHVDLLNGEISVTSQVGKGTRFRLCLPIIRNITTTALTKDLYLPAESHLANFPEKAIDENAVSQKGMPDFELNYILIIEDNLEVVEYLKTILEVDYRVGVARNGSEGIKLAFEIIPDLIISDVMMPEKDGYEVCDSLKQDIRTSHIPVILLTARASQEDKVEGIRHGADAYLVKPFHREELLARIHQLINLREKLQLRFSGSEDSPASTPRKKEEAFIQEARRMIEANLDNDELDMHVICKNMGMSYTQFYRKIKALTDLTVTLFVREIRLEKAHHLLQTSGLNVSEVAYEVGFKDPAYFSRVFAKKYGIPPNNLLP